jgi:hypothetical protein
LFTLLITELRFWSHKICYLNKIRKHETFDWVTIHQETLLSVDKHSCSILHNTCLTFKKSFISHSCYCHQTNSNNWLETYLSISVSGTKNKTSELPLLLFSEICSVSCDINPLTSLMLQSARDLNVPCQPKHSKALLLSYTFKCLLKKMQSFCPCSRALNRSGKGLNRLDLV